MFFLRCTMALIALIPSIPIITSESTPQSELRNLSETIDSMNVKILHNAINFANARIITQILTSTTSEERERLSDKFRAMNRSLIEDLKNTFSDKFQEALVAFMIPPHQFYAYEIKKSIHDDDIQQSAIIDFLCILNNSLLNKIIEVYPQYANGESLKHDLKLLKPKNFQNLISSCLREPRGRIIKFIKDLDPVEFLKEEELIKYMSQCSYEQIFQLILSFEHTRKRNLEDILRERYDGKFLRTLMAIIRYSQSKKLYFAKRFHESLSGSEVDYNSLLCLALMDRTEDFKNINQFYSEIYKEDLADTIDREIPPGNYRFFLENLLVKKQPLPVRDESQDELLHPKFNLTELTN